MEKFYKVSVDDLGPEIIQKAKDFAEKVTAETYDRFNYQYDRRKETIYIGKLAEEVFIKFAEEYLGVTLSSNYDIYLGISNVDKYDFFINSVEVDIKSSKDTKNEGIEKCYSYFNFPVPTDQQIKDITISILYDYAVHDFYIVSWIDKETYRKSCELRKLPVGGGTHKEFYLYKLKYGKNIFELKEYLKL